MAIRAGVSKAMRQTQVLPVDAIHPPNVDAETDLSSWFHETYPTAETKSSSCSQLRHLFTAVHALRQSSTPVAFPTETVYGLGADATRSEAVRGIYQAKQRPSDNPLIVHIGSLPQLRNLIRPSDRQQPQIVDHMSNGDLHSHRSAAPGIASLSDPIPEIYRPLIRKFWPGPLTILLPLPSPSPLAPEVTGGSTTSPSTLRTFGVRMPSLPLARLLIALTDRPLAAPSANASTRPSPTTAQHVRADLNGRIDFILDGGACTVGVESTVVDALGDVPLILRPGGIGIEELRALGGKWADVKVAYRDRSEHGTGDANGLSNGAMPEGPRAPGMKYKHYAPRGRVLLFEPSRAKRNTESAAKERVLIELSPKPGQSPTPTRPVLALVRTCAWSPFVGLDVIDVSEPTTPHSSAPPKPLPEGVTQGRVRTRAQVVCKQPTEQHSDKDKDEAAELFSIYLGSDVREIARGLFGALRTLDQLGCDLILVEGIDDADGELAAAVMNRLRKAAES